MNIKLEYFSDRALAHLEAAIDTAVVSAIRAQCEDDEQATHLIELHRLVVEERMRRESARRR